MAETLRIFVSATKDLEAERAVIGRAVAELPVQIGVEIRRTPARGASYDDIFELIANCDRVYFLLGKDITAPSGAEWHLAWQLERSILPLRSPARLTPAAQEFVRTSLVEWTVFRNGPHLSQIVTLDLVRILNHPTNRYGLTVSELEMLNLHAARLRQSLPPTDGEPGGAEGGGVLLDAINRDPVDGVLLET
ncbi:MAG: hypothetical protein KatS3mg050_3909 [Litorilinea sp.]|nr:MAG: hypothetical protein KatS3mg050_3909 [Litorilinea sp.]